MCDVNGGLQSSKCSTSVVTKRGWVREAPIHRSVLWTNVANYSGLWDTHGDYHSLLCGPQELLQQLAPWHLPGSKAVAVECFLLLCHQPTKGNYNLVQGDGYVLHHSLCLCLNQ